MIQRQDYGNNIPHHIWCKYFTKQGVCSVCDELYYKYPYKESGDDIIPGQLTNRYFPGSIAKFKLEEILYSCEYKIGDRVEKFGIDYKYEGIIISIFYRLNGKLSLVAEDDWGILHIFSEEDIKLKNNKN